MTIENENKLKEAIKSVCRMDKESGYVDELLAKDECDLIDELGFDSLLFVELIVGIEDALDFEFDMNNLDINKLRKLSELKNVVNEYLLEGQTCEG